MTPTDVIDECTWQYAPQEGITAAHHSEVHMLTDSHARLSKLIQENPKLKCLPLQADIWTDGHSQFGIAVKMPSQCVSLFSLGLSLEYIEKVRKVLGGLLRDL